MRFLGQAKRQSRALHALRLVEMTIAVLILGVDRSGINGTTLLVLHILTLAKHGIGRVMNKRFARGIELASGYLALKVARRRKLDNLLGRHLAHPLHTFVVGVILMGWLVGDGDGAEALYLDAGRLALTEAVAYLVEHGRQYRLDSGAADAATLYNIGHELFEIQTG